MSSPWSVVRCLGVLDGGGWRWLGMDATVEGMERQRRSVLSISGTGYARDSGRAAYQ